MNTSQSFLAVFAKYWQPGAVKTRLAAMIGDTAAAELHFHFLKTTLRRCECPHLDCRRQLYFDPPQRREDFQQLAGPTWELHPQCKGDLGARLQHFFSNSFRCGARYALAIGSDSPNLPIPLIEEAMRTLDRGQAVVGPSLDGGYYLIGLAQHTSAIFDRVSWGGPHVLRETIERLGASNIPFVQLAPWYDVDEFADLERLYEDVRESDEIELQVLCEPIRRVVER